jgi:hypothetical protein
LRAKTARLASVPCRDRGAKRHRQRAGDAGKEQSLRQRKNQQDDNARTWADAGGENHPNKFADIGPNVAGLTASHLAIEAGQISR